MKKCVLKLMPASLLMMLAAMSWSCGEKTKPEDEVRNYGRMFIEKVSANQIDSLKGSYPDISKADSIMPLKSDTIMVAATAEPGEYDLTLTEGVVLKVTRQEDGGINVKESKGLFAFPEDKVDIAKKTGMWDDSLNDSQLADRMKDDDFFQFISSRSNINPKDIISVGKLVVTKDWPGIEMESGRGYYLFTNKTDMPIAATDYVVLMAGENAYSGERWNYTKPGLNLEPKGTAKLSVEFRPRADPSVKGIKFNISDEELKAKFAPLKGNEYQEYLDSKK